MDNKDDYILKHYGHMTMEQIGNNIGISKSSVSRRVSKLKASGEIDDAIAEDAKRETQQARNALGGCSMNNHDRVKALCELRDRLHDELSTTGGANLARVSLEYRRTLEEITAISKNIEIAMSEGHALDTIEATRLKLHLREKFNEVADRETVTNIIESTLLYLDNNGVISYKPLTRILSQAEMADEGILDVDIIDQENGVL